MPSKQVRISEKSREKLRALAEREHIPISTLLDEAVDQFVRQKYAEQFNAGYERLRSDEKAWQKEQAERAAWDATLLDGLDEDY